MSEQTAFPGYKRPWRRRMAVVAVAVVVLALAGIGWLYEQFQPPRPGSSVKVVVSPGQTSDQIAQQLESLGLIKNRLVFRLYTLYTHSGRQIRAGDYEFKQGESIPAMVSQLVKGAVAKPVMVTIPEGFTVVEMADRLAAMHVCSSQAFIQEVQTGHFTEPFMSQLPKSKAIKYRLEGYLFPDTYAFTPGESAHQVVDEMLQDFQRHMTPKIAADMKKEHMTLPQLITEASLVEKEAKVTFERPLIASVIQNRLARHMKLQLDATVLYVIGHENVVTDAQTKVNSPYNTYVVNGLPPGPIASPGMASIEAVLHPAHTKYLYYVVKNDGSGEDYFAETYAQQLHNELLSQQNLKKYLAQKSTK
ncbi:endolytic transglycosylase MltG [Alicyclobacillus tolerans]|uniref:endolytic transglycosylase MltG n=1 Tax=Alicyclobacillus tolerans TaxID=90970 RepID=UPI001F000C6D|nr:endolytic transglycosylase MltG [Alicyclobacillus tolerans]MCF8563299.1 endolytic transglycosylase MltG [Alicyclobacillus tolerans]